MDHGYLRFDEGVTLVGGGDPRGEDMGEAMAVAPVLIAADGGANICVSKGLSPAAVIGDFDSLSAASRAALPDATFLEVDEQESTDFEKCLERISAPFVLATGFAEGRLDHTLAVFSVLARRVGPPAILVGREDVVFAAPERLALGTRPGLRLSLFPMKRVRGTSTGLRWPIDGLILDPMGRIGTSNLTTGAVELAFEAPGCLVLMPREALSVAIAALTG